VVTDRDAAPPLRVPVPSVVVPSRNVTLPVTVPVVAVTVATSRTGELAGAGFGVTAK